MRSEWRRDERFCELLDNGLSSSSNRFSVVGLFDDTGVSENTRTCHELGGRRNLAYGD
jgi:hypothetical protein